MRDWLAGAASIRPEHPYLVDSGGAHSFAEVEARVAAAAGGLRVHGVQPGDRVAVWAESSLESVVAMLSVPRAGAVLVPVNTRLTPAEVGSVLALTGARVMVGGPNREMGVARLALDALIGAPAAAGEVEPAATHSIVLTSGSSGFPKAVRITWGNLEASAAASAVHLEHRPDDRWLCVLPLFHIGGLSILVRSARQASTVLLEERFDPIRAAPLLRDGEATLASLVALSLQRVLEAHPGPYRGVRAVLVGGGPIPAGLLERAAGAGLPVLPTYGLTETASQIATLPLAEGLSPRYRVAAVPGAEVRVVHGRIQVRGPMVSPGYFGEPDRPAGEWFDTGDRGALERDGSLRVLGRADDIVVTGGENVDPVEVEVVVRAHPNVEDAAVVGVADPIWGQRLVAAVEGVADASEVRGFVRERLAGFKVPKQWLVLARLPRLPNGKIDRRAVVAMAVEDVSRSSGGDEGA